MINMTLSRVLPSKFSVRYINTLKSVINFDLRKTVMTHNGIKTKHLLVESYSSRTVVESSSSPVDSSSTSALPKKQKTVKAKLPKKSQDPDKPSTVLLGKKYDEDPNKPSTVLLGNKYDDVSSYLEYSRTNGVSTSSTVFRGNIYELRFLEFLKNNFALERIIHQGGADDKGIDLSAHWDVCRTFEKSDDIGDKTMITVNSTRKVKPIVLRKKQVVRLYVQCKCWKTSKVDAQMIREINGTFNNTTMSHASKASNVSFVMIVTPTTMTKQAISDFDKSSLPLMFVRFSQTKLKKDADNSFNLSSYNLGQFESIYCNPMAIALLKGLKWSEFMNLLVIDQN